MLGFTVVRNTSVKQIAWLLVAVAFLSCTADGNLVGLPCWYHRDRWGGKMLIGTPRAE